VSGLAFRKWLRKQPGAQLDIEHVRHVARSMEVMSPDAIDELAELGAVLRNLADTKGARTFAMPPERRDSRWAQGGGKRLAADHVMPT